MAELDLTADAAWVPLAADLDADTLSVGTAVVLRPADAPQTTHVIAFVRRVSPRMRRALVEPEYDLGRADAWRVVAINPGDLA